MRWRLGIVLALTGAPMAAADGLIWKAGFGRATLWNDGNAEVSVYSARDMRYGVSRSSRAVLIVVAEDLLRDALVKADSPPAELATLRVLKLNHVRSIPTGVYAYQQMLSVFAGADRLDPVKLTVTSHEWCGNSFVEWRSDLASLAIRSYFQTPGDQDVPLATDGAVFYDALPLELRGLDFERTRNGSLRVIDSLFTSRPVPPTVEGARLEVTRPSRLPAVYRVVLRRGERADAFEFETAFPHRLVRWDRNDGGSLRLIGSHRFRYWEKNAPGDERLLEPSVTR
jgi:hypothetical protein